MHFGKMEWKWVHQWSHKGSDPHNTCFQKWGMFALRIPKVLLIQFVEDHYLHEKSGEVSIKARSPAALLAVIGQVSKHTTVK